MKDLRHLALQIPAGLQFNFAKRVISVGLKPNNEQRAECDHLAVYLKSMPHSETLVKVIADVHPAQIIPIKDGKILEVRVFPYHCCDHGGLTPFRVKAKLKNRLLAAGFANGVVKGGLYNPTPICCEYCGIFDSLEDFYKALKHVYPQY